MPMSATALNVIPLQPTIMATAKKLNIGAKQTDCVQKAISAVYQLPFLGVAQNMLIVTTHTSAIKLHNVRSVGCVLLSMVTNSPAAKAGCRVTLP